LISDADRQRKPVIFIGTGTEALQSEESRRIIATILAPRVAHWSVRCDRDKARLADYGVRPDSITVAADMAWMLGPVSDDFGSARLKQCGLDLDPPLVGVNINSERLMLQQEPRLFEKLAEFLDALVEKYHVRVLFLCNEVRESETFDKAASLKVLASMRHSDEAFLFPNEYWTPQQMMSLIRCCRVTLSTRYHFCLFSALEGVPFIALKRSDKVDDLCWDLNWPFAMSLTSLDVSLLSDLFSEIERRRVEVIEDLRRRVGVLLQRALKNSVAIDAMVERVSS
jgi:polysaccharide pyruvyl transferase WcaK-like protein